MPTVRQRARARRAATPSGQRFRLADLGVYGFDRHETTILAALVTEDPLLLVGRSGTGKTFLLNTLSEARSGRVLIKQGKYRARAWRSSLRTRRSSRNIC